MGLPGAGAQETSLVRMGLFGGCILGLGGGDECTKTPYLSLDKVSCSSGLPANLYVAKDDLRRFAAASSRAGMKGKH